MGGVHALWRLLRERRRSRSCLLIINVVMEFVSILFVSISSVSTHVARTRGSSTAAGYWSTRVCVRGPAAVLLTADE